jgi:hypothetical protein
MIYKNNYSKTWLIQNLRDQNKAFLSMKNLYNSKLKKERELANS